MKPVHILIALAAMYTPVAWSQCAPGIPSAGNPGCIPPGQSNSPYSQAAPAQPEPVWASRWGAIAVDLNTARSGTAADEESQSNAENTARRVCESNGGSNCEIILSYFNQCAAVAQNPEGGPFGKAHAVTLEKAESMALAACPGSGCKVIYSKCSLPVKVR
ncbi:hypothetical protein FHW69_001710 [Luteibacter sp. Sphag1AF]|uniref:DUF4189 domain-containing protein n=1 Tax=Luteibacter sp. Sphag1AF TaxID=2587031 RepID=UPI0016179769|nr:DUF4189 domain-containing protein [Luteibacter sp. Sphag1AF]MBB3227109.1 hypothetical protein [Luteibacter sp. Sphag1AF]